MTKVYPFLLLTLTLTTGCADDSGNTNTTTTNTTTTNTTTTNANTTTSTSTTGTALNSEFVVVDNPYADQSGYTEFTTFVDVWGLCVFGEAGVSDEKVLFVANVLAELIDNDEDGFADDPALLEKLIEEHATMPIFKREGSDAENDFFDNYNGQGVSAVLYNGEVDPSQPGHWGDDATVEELMHTVNHVGHVALYPDTFGLSPNSSRLSAAMDVARGGQYTSIPSNYPEAAWYHYDDFSCDYQCMAIEYIYWAQVSNMGILDDSQTCSGIANEWELCTPELLQSTDLLMMEILNDPALHMPSNAPNGTYGQR